MNYNVSDITDILPHRDPFLFIDRIIELIPGERIVAEKNFSPKEWFFKGHFPGRPIVPGVIITEALAQASGLLIGLSWKEEKVMSKGENPILFLASINVKYSVPVNPSETLRLESGLKKEFGRMFLFDVKAYVGESRTAKGTLSLAEGRSS